MSAEMFLRNSRLSVPERFPEKSLTAKPKGIEKQETSAELLAEAKEKLKDLRGQSTALQHRSTQELIQRVKDVGLWKAELEREIKEITIGTDGLHLKAIKLEDARILVKGAENVCEESIKVRLKRQDFKLAHEDRLDRELQTERDLIQTALNSIDQLMEQIDNQVRLNSSMKHQLESDWSDKTEAVEMDSHALSLSNNLTYVGMKPGSLGFVETMSTLEQWHSYTNNNMKDSNQLRSLTKALSQEIFAFLQETAKELRTQAQVIEAALVDNIRFAVEQQSTMGGMLDGKRAEINLLKKSIAELQAELSSKQSPLAVALARLNTRSCRPRMELCDDSAHKALLDEVAALQDVTNRLNSDIEHYKERLNELQQQQLQLEVQHEKMADNGKIDSDILRNIRSLYPSRIQASGFTAKSD